MDRGRVMIPSLCVSDVTSSWGEIMARRRRATRATLRSAAFVLALATAGCAAIQGDKHSDRNNADTTDSFASGVAALEAGRTAQARELLSDATARQPTDPSRETALALAYQLDNSSSPENLEMALVGYQSALRNEPDAFWPAVLAGRAAFDRGRYNEATAFFAQAALADPRDGRTFEALAAAAYNAGDMLLARAAIERALALRSNSTNAVRLDALASEMLGDHDHARLMLANYRTLDSADADALAQRLDLLKLTAATDQAGSAPGAAPRPAVSAETRNQIAVDVAIVLSQNEHRDRVGVNLLDGLQLQFGLTGVHLTLKESGVKSTTSTLTRAISIPDLTYNMNLFNRFGHYYQVVARPTLTAYRATPSEFFVGRTLKVAVRGVNSSTLEQIDVGITLRVTPIRIFPDHTKLEVTAERSFLTQDPTGTFEEAITTYRQTVAATADVRFGETLVLSGLSESVNDATQSKVPALGDAPIIGLPFNERTTHEVRDAVLVLLTPSHPVTLPGEPWARPEAVDRLVRLWADVIDPSSNGKDVASRIAHARLFTRMQPGDAPLMWPDAKAQRQEAIKALLLSKPL